MPKRTGFDLRGAADKDASAVARIYLACWRDGYRGIVPDAVLDRMNLVRETASWRRAIAATPPAHQILVVERAGAGVVGFLSYGPERDEQSPALRRPGAGSAGGATKGRGEIFTLYMLPRFQGAGGGRRLLAGAAEALLAEGYNGAVLWVLSENLAARGFYERLNGQASGRRQSRVGGADLAITAYVWPDLEALEEATARLGQIPLAAPLDSVAPGA